MQLPKKNSKEPLIREKALEEGSSESVKMDDACVNPSECATDPKWTAPGSCINMRRPLLNEKCESRFLSGASCELKESLLSLTPRSILNVMAISCELMLLPTWS